MTSSAAIGSVVLSAVDAAIRAPSIHNSQPWRFGLGVDRVDVWADRSRQLRVTDPDGRALRVSCGAAIFNLRLGLCQLGYEPEVALFPEPGSSDLLATVRCGNARPISPAEARLYAAIAHRHSNREPFADMPVPQVVRAQLREAAQVEGAWLDLVMGPAALEVASELVHAADRVLTSNAAYVAELAAWTRHDGGPGDGVVQAAAGFAPELRDLLVQRDFGGPHRAPGHEFEAEPLVAVLGSDGDSIHDDLVAGQALQRVLLTATAAGLVTSLMSQPIDVPAIREELRVGLRRYGSPKMLLRAGYGVPGAPTPRRPLADVLI